MRYVVTILLLALIGLTAKPLSASECKAVDMAYAPTWFPLSYQDDRNVARGIALSIHKQIFSELGRQVNFRGDLPWKRQIEMVESGELDAIATINYNEEREQQFALSDSIHTYSVKIFTLTERAVAYQTLDDLKKYRGAYPKEASYGGTFDNFAKNTALLQGVSEARRMVKLLIEKRLDYFVMPEHLGYHLIEQSGQKQNILAQGPAIHKQNVHLAMSKQSPCSALVGEYNQILNRLKTSGELENVSRHYN